MGDQLTKVDARLTGMNPEVAEQARAALRRHVLEPLAKRCVDAEYGGFLVEFDDRWQPVGPQEKTLEHASRSTVAFALMERAMPGEGCEQLARHGCAFLKSALWDAADGGFFAQVDREGRPLFEGLKHPHAVTYAVRAFLASEPYLPPGEGRMWAERALAWLEDVTWDRAHGGYWGSYRRNNEIYPDGANLPTRDGLDPIGLTTGFKEVNTLGDAIEMLTMCVAYGMGGKCGDRLAWLIDLVSERLTDPGGALPYLYRSDWRPVPDLVRMGQQFQMAHRVLAVAEMKGVVKTSRLLTDFGLSSARHPAGGFCLAVSGEGRRWPSSGPSADLRQWWVQLEAARAMHALACQESIDDDARSAYGRARDEQWAFLRDHFFDDEFGGIREVAVAPGTRRRTRLPEWLRRREPSGSRKTHGWKDPLHEVETFLALIQD